MSFLLGNSFPLSAHETFPTVREVVEEYPYILKCDTACHKVKNITLAKKHRTTRPECQQCHIGIDRTPISPFLPPEKVFLSKTSGSAIKPQSKFTLFATKKYPKFVQNLEYQGFAWIVSENGELFRADPEVNDVKEVSILKRSD